MSVRMFWDTSPSPHAGSKLTWLVEGLGDMFDTYVPKPFRERQNNAYISDVKELLKVQEVTEVKGEPEVAVGFNSAKIALKKISIAMPI